jgi:hypothetical protein
MGGANGSPELKRIEDWLFAILRFTITRDAADRTAVMTIAANMDRPCAYFIQSDFSYFVRTSQEVCSAIAGHDRAKIAVLHRYLSEIGNDRLRRALAAALNIERPATRRIGKLGRQHSGDLWRGLPTRQ